MGYNLILSKFERNNLNIINFHINDPFSTINSKYNLEWVKNIDKNIYCI